MTVSILLSLAALAGPPAAAPAPALAPAFLQDEVPLEEQIASCGDDTARLWELAQTLKTNSKYADARKVMEKIVALDPEHADARKGLGHQKYSGRWFKSSVELMMFRRKEEKEMREKGLVRLGDEWVPAADAPFLRMNWVKDEGGQWRDPQALARLEQEAKYREEGWEQQDLTWIPPDEFDKWDQGLWKCGDEWLTLEAADEYHSKFPNFWTVPGQHFITISTCTRNGVDWANVYADGAYPHLVQIFGKEPIEKPHFVILNSLEQYNAFAGGDQAQGLPPSEATGFSSLHHAFFAESFFDARTQPPTYRGCGVGFWDYKPEMTGWGKFSIRHAAGLSYAEAIDPSWDAISQFAVNPTGGFQANTFWNEKKIPNWLRFGGASYVETFCEDEYVPEGSDPLMNRTWAFGQIQAQGGLRPLAQVFAFQRDLNDIPGSSRLNYEAGLVVAYILDGGDSEIAALHEAWKKAFMAGEGYEEAMNALQEALIAKEAQVRAFAGLS